MGTLVGLNIATKTANYTCTDQDAIILVDCTSGAITITLPVASTPGQCLQIKKIDSSGNAVTVSRQGTDTIESATTDTIYKQYEAKTYVSEGVGGTRWFIVSYQRPAGSDYLFGTCYLDIGQQSTPTNPSSGTRRLFVDSADGKIKVRTSAGSSVSLEEQASSSGDNITVNGSALVDADFDDTTPNAPAGAVNVKWQKDGGSPANVSAGFARQ